MHSILKKSQCTGCPPQAASHRCSCWVPGFQNALGWVRYWWWYHCMCTLVTVVHPASSTVIYLQPFTSDFPCADIYEMITPDLLHQVIKGTFKDHLVTWVCKYLKRVYGERHTGIIIDDIDRRYVFQFTCGDHNANTWTALLQYPLSLACADFHMAAISSSGQGTTPRHWWRYVCGCVLSLGQSTETNSMALGLCPRNPGLCARWDRQMSCSIPGCMLHCQMSEHWC
jgi:hypothetical protein